MKSRFDVLAQNESRMYKWKKYKLSQATKYIWERYNYKTNHTYKVNYSPAMVLEEDTYGYKKYKTKYWLNGFYNLQTIIPQKYTYWVDTVQNILPNGDPVWSHVLKRDVGPDQFMTDTYAAINQVNLSGAGWTSNYYVGYMKIRVIKEDFYDDEEMDKIAYEHVLSFDKDGYINAKIGSVYTGIGWLGPAERGVDGLKYTLQRDLSIVKSPTESSVYTNKFYVGMDIWFNTDYFAERQKKLGKMDNITYDQFIKYAEDKLDIDKLAYCSTLYTNGEDASFSSVYLQERSKEMIKSEGGFGRCGGGIYYATDKNHSTRFWKDDFAQKYGYREPQSDQRRPARRYVNLFAQTDEGLGLVLGLAAKNYMLFSRDSTRSNKIIMIDYDYFDDEFGPAGNNNGEIIHCKLFIPVKLVPYSPDSADTYKDSGSIPTDNSYILRLLTTNMAGVSVIESTDFEEYTIAQVDAYKRTDDEPEWTYSKDLNDLLTQDTISNDIYNTVLVAKGTIVPAVITLAPKLIDGTDTYKFVQYSQAYPQPTTTASFWDEQFELDITYEPDFDCYLGRHEPKLYYNSKEYTRNTMNVVTGSKIIENSDTMQLIRVLSGFPYNQSAFQEPRTIWEQWELKVVKNWKENIDKVNCFPSSKIVSEPTEGRLVEGLGYYWLPVRGYVKNYSWDAAFLTWTEVGSDYTTNDKKGIYFTPAIDGRPMYGGSDSCRIEFKKMLTCWESSSEVSTKYEATDLVATVSSYDISEYPIDSSEPYNGYIYKYVGSVEVERFNDTGTYDFVFSKNISTYPKSGIKVENGEAYWYQYDGLDEYVITSYDETVLLNNIKYSQNIGSSNNVSIGTVGGAVIEFDVWRPLAAVLPYYNYWGTVGYQFQNTGIYYNFGRFQIKELTENGTDKTHVVAYDSVALLDKSARELLDNIPYPITAFKLFIQICAYCGIKYKMNIDFLNSDAKIIANFGNENITCRDVMEYIAQISGTCIVADIDGYLVFKDLSEPRTSWGSTSTDTYNIDTTMFPIKLPNVVQYKVGNDAVQYQLRDDDSDDLLVLNYNDNPFTLAPDVEYYLDLLLYKIRSIGTLYSWDMKYDSNYYRMACGDSWVISSDTIAPRRGIITGITMDSSGVTMQSSGEIQGIKSLKTDIIELQDAIAEVTNSFQTITINSVERYEYWTENLIQTISCPNYQFSADNLSFDMDGLKFYLGDQFNNLYIGKTNVPIPINSNMAYFTIDGDVLKIYDTGLWAYNNITYLYWHDTTSGKYYYGGHTEMVKDFTDADYYISNSKVANHINEIYAADVASCNNKAKLTKVSSIIGYMLSKEHTIETSWSNEFELDPTVEEQWQSLMTYYKDYGKGSFYPTTYITLHSGNDFARLTFDRSNIWAHFYWNNVVDVNISGTDLQITCNNPPEIIVAFESNDPEVPNPITIDGQVVQSWKVTESLIYGTDWDNINIRSGISLTSGEANLMRTTLNAVFSILGDNQRLYNFQLMYLNNEIVAVPYGNSTEPPFKMSFSKRQDSTTGVYWLTVILEGNS